MHVVRRKGTCCIYLVLQLLRRTLALCMASTYSWPDDCNKCAHFFGIFRNRLEVDLVDGFAIILRDKAAIAELISEIFSGDIVVVANCFSWASAARNAHNNARAAFRFIPVFTFHRCCNMLFNDGCR